MISQTNCRTQYDGNNVATEFARAFPVTDKTEVLVVRTEDAVDTILVVDTDYTVNGVGSDDDADWTILCPVSGAPLTPSQRLTIVPNIPYTQLTEFGNQGGFFPDIHEAAFDRVILCLQQIQEEVDRCLKQPIGAESSPDLIEDILEASAAAVAAAAAAEAAQAAAEAAVATAEGDRYAVDAGVADAYVITTSPPLLNYNTGATIRVKISNTNTGGSTINVDGLGIKTILRDGTNPTQAGDLIAGGVYAMTYDGTNFCMFTGTPVGNGTVTNAKLATMATKTAKANITGSTASPTDVGVLDFNNAFSMAYVDVASATIAADFPTAQSTNIRVTGTTAVTALGTLASGIRRKVTFAAILTLTHNATSLILPTAGNIVTAAGDCAEFVSLGSGNWRCEVYTRADGSPLAAAAIVAGVDLITATATWTVPAGITACVVTVAGGGGSGARGASGNVATGGGSGGVSVKKVTGLTPGGGVTVTCGVGGASKTTTGSGNAGGTSSFGAHCSATGGGGGTTGSTSAVRAGGTGGVGSGGDINYTAQNAESTDVSGGHPGGEPVLANVLGAAAATAGQKGCGGGGGNNVNSGAGGTGYVLIQF